MIHLVYVSSATRPLDENDLRHLLQQARDRNKRQHITGMLLYVNELFFQILEGEAADIEDVYATIVNDERNKNNFLILKDSIQERSFPNWSMGFKQLDLKNGEELPAYTDFLNTKMEPQEFDNAELVVRLLYQFKEANVT